MKQKKIGEVVLEYAYYDGKENYSDGDIEDILLDAAKNDKMEELLHLSNDWAVLYHCSHIRENLLEWYPFKKDSALLEIGSGCGALTGLFSRKTGSVTCIELSERRSLINAYRNKTCDNIKILLGNFQNIQIKEKYDYITLIGVWEYAGAYISGKNPYLEMLKKLKSYLKEDGKLLIAIENKMGLKYWNGAVEDHTGKMYSGLNDYTDDRRGARTFSRPEIERLLGQAGWDLAEFYYPVPDYKLPEVIFSDRRPPQPGELRNYRKDYNAVRVYNFYDAAVCDQLCNDKVMPYFANSFLVECGGSHEKKIIYAKYSRLRKEEYDISTLMVEEGKERCVEKKALTEKAEEHIKRMAGRKKGSPAMLREVKGEIQEKAYVTEFIEGTDLSSSFYQYRNDPEAFLHKVQEAFRLYLTPDAEELSDFEATDAYREFFGNAFVDKGKCLASTNIDLIFSNLMSGADGNVYCVDNEWIFDFPIPYEYVMWRAANQLYLEYMIYLRNQISRQEFLEKAGIKTENIEIYEQMERNFRRKVLRKDYMKNYVKQTMQYDFRFY